MDIYNCVLGYLKNRESCVSRDKKIFTAFGKKSNISDKS